MNKDKTITVRLPAAFVENVLDEIAASNYSENRSKLVEEILVEHAEEYGELNQQQRDYINNREKQLEDDMDKEILKQEIKEATHERYLISKVKEWRNQGVTAKEAKELLHNDAMKRIAERRDSLDFLKGLRKSLKGGYPESHEINGIEVSLIREY